MYYIVNVIKKSKGPKTVSCGAPHVVVTNATLCSSFQRPMSVSRTTTYRSEQIKLLSNIFLHRTVEFLHRTLAGSFRKIIQSATMRDWTDRPETSISIPSVHRGRFKFIIIIGDRGAFCGVSRAWWRNPWTEEQVRRIFSHVPKRNYEKDVVQTNASQDPLENYWRNARITGNYPEYNYV